MMVAMSGFITNLIVDTIVIWYVGRTAPPGEVLANNKKPNLIARLGLFFMQMWYNKLRYIASKVGESAVIRFSRTCKLHLLFTTDRPAISELRTLTHTHKNLLMLRSVTAKGYNIATYDSHLISGSFFVAFFWVQPNYNSNSR